MKSVPARERGQASGMRATTTNAGQVLSIGLFFSLMLVGLAAMLPQSMEAALLAQNVPAEVAHQVAGAPPVASLFAAFLGYNPMGELIPADVLHTAAAADAVDTLTGHAFLPRSDVGDRSSTGWSSPSASRRSSIWWLLLFPRARAQSLPRSRR